jgi:hypothetical protein
VLHHAQGAGLRNPVHAIVPDRKFDPIGVSPEFNENLRRATVSDGVQNGVLGDPVQVSRRQWVRYIHRVCMVKRACGARGGGRVCRELLKSNGKPMWLRCDRIEPPRDAPRVTQRRPKQSGDFRDVFPVQPPASLKPVLHRMD